MLKTVSSVANALGALNYKGTWNATTNTPTLASGVGTQGDYYVVSVAGATDLDGITNWGVGDWAAFNGSVWQRVEGGADGNFVNLDVTGTSTLAGLSATTGAFSNNVIIGDYALTDIRLSEVRTNKALFSINADGATNGNGTTISYSWANGGQGPLKFNNAAGEVASFTPSGNLAFVSGKGIDFSATAGTGTSELFSDYEEGVYTPTLGGMSGGTVTYTTQTGIYTKVGRQVTVYFNIVVNTNTNTGGNTFLSVPFSASTGGFVGPLGINTSSNAAITHVSFFASGAQAYFYTAGGGTLDGSAVANGSQLKGSITYFV
tara:strand:+ start:444 stop:1397 length:954 start_codon:yes stop_codon:yes gene_type:complete